VLVVHLKILHLVGRTGVFFIHSGVGKISFHPYYIGKDLINVVVYVVVVFILVVSPYTLGEVELFEEANSLNSPLHILPE